MNLGSQSISNQSQTFNDYRYQKALKQISKLINVNRQIKMQSQRHRQQNQQLSTKVSELFHSNAQLEHQLEMLSHEYEQLSMTYSQLQDYCKKAEYEQKQLLEDNQLETVQKMQIQKRHACEVQELQRRFGSQINEVILQVQDRDGQISELEMKLQYMGQLEQNLTVLRTKYDQKTKENEQLAHKIDQLNNEILNASTKLKQQPNEDLVNKLRINEQWIKSLNEQNYNLKQKVLQQQYKKQRQRCNETLLQNTPYQAATFMNLSTNNPSSSTTNNASQLLLREYSKQVQKKFKKLQDEKLKLQTKYAHIKAKCQQLEGRCHGLEKEVNLLTVKVNGYQQLTERQQSEIENMIAQFGEEMERVVWGRRRGDGKHGDKRRGKQPMSERTLPMEAGTGEMLGRFDVHCNSKNNNNDGSSSREKQLKTLIENLQSQITQNKSLAEEKDKLIRYLEERVASLQAERIEIHKAYIELEDELMSSSQGQQNNNMDLSKTSKNYTLKGEPILKTHTSGTKNGGKVFVINGKKYESQLLKNQSHKSSRHSKEDDDMNNNNNSNNTTTTARNNGFFLNKLPIGGEKGESSVGANNNNTNKIEYISSSRSYGNSNEQQQQTLANGQRA